MMPAVYDKYTERQKTYKVKQYMWDTLHYTLGCSSALLAATAGFKGAADILPPHIHAALPFASALLAGLLTVFAPAAKRRAYAEARDTLRIARTRFETEGAPVSALNDAFERAQNIVAKK